MRKKVKSQNREAYVKYGSTSNRNVRNSNFELLRIVAIVFITMHHLLINGLDICGYNKPFEISSSSAVAVMLNSMFVGGVNLFLLISGWFGIKKVIGGIVRLMFDCAIYGLLVCLIAFCFLGKNLNLSDFFHAIKFTNGWFVPNYMYLLLLSPLIECSLKKVDVKKIRVWMLLFTFAQCYLGYILKFVDHNGYSAVNFIYLYCMGRYLRLEYCDFLKKSKTYFFAIYLLTCMFLGGIFLFAANVGIHIDSLRFWSYNNPLVLLASLALFVCFSKMNIQNAKINFFATSVLGVYLFLSNFLITESRNIGAKIAFSYCGFLALLIYGVILVLLVGSLILIVNWCRKPILDRINLFVSKIDINNEQIRK